MCCTNRWIKGNKNGRYSNKSVKCAQFALPVHKMTCTIIFQYSVSSYVDQILQGQLVILLNCTDCSTSYRDVYILLHIADFP